MSYYETMEKSTFRILLSLPFYMPVNPGIISSNPYTYIPSTIAEYVYRFIGSKSNFNLGKPHLDLFCSLPEDTLSRLKLSKKLFRRDIPYKMHYESRRLDNIMKSILSVNIPVYLQKFEFIIHENMNKDLDQFLQNDYVFIENIFDYLQQILANIAIRQCYGEAAKNDQGILNAVMSIAGKKISYTEKYLSTLSKFRFFNRKSNAVRAREYLMEFVTKGKFQELNKGSWDLDQTVVNLVQKNQEELNIPDDIFFTIIPDYVSLFVTVFGEKLPNFLIDISLNPRIHKILKDEQKKIMAKHGKGITEKQINEMIYLDAALTESLRLDVINLSMREALCDFFLPNGVCIPKGAVVKFSNITHNRSRQIFKRHPHDHIPERQIELGTKLEVTSKTNLAWGFGRKCPYRKYCATFLKLFAATLLRTYDVSQGEWSKNITHDGYVFEYGASHAKKSLYLSRREI
ncbi:hypothetical protein BB560_006787 [Smittium megazygosporum]|uniref:Cytochrome P450 n=1 Tax=Smittium megazygosporum TaxID=133381 RepID=A0A2T9Y1L0_9FUNG|nr:hypothetical protein BB560_006787 [Smittium megazygosporum]